MRRASSRRCPGSAARPSTAGKFLDQLYGDELHRRVPRRARPQLDEVEVDRTRVKPIVKITGEFWAQTTEGDGNFNMFQFLEREGAQVLVEPIGTWIMYMIHQAKQMNTDRARRDRGRGDALGVAHRQAHGRRPRGPRKKNAKLTLAEAIFKREWNRLREALGGIPHELTDQYELQRARPPVLQLARRRRRGPPRGRQEHLLLEQGPVPHGAVAQAVRVHALHAVRRRRSRRWSTSFKDMIYLPIETSGEGEINAHSRVQMALGEAQGQGEAGVRAGARGDRPHAREMRGPTSTSTPSSSGRSTRCPHYQGHRRHRRELRAPRRASSMAADGVRLEAARADRWEPLHWMARPPAPLHRSRRRVDHGQGRGRRPRHRRDPLAGLPAPRDQAAGEVPRVPARMIETDFPIPHDAFRIFITGSGGSGIAPRIGAKFVQEVNAVSLAVEKLYPDVRLGHRARRPGRQDHHLQGRTPRRARRRRSRR